MQYISTRDARHTATLSAALARGLAPDDRAAAVELDATGMAHLVAFDLPGTHTADELAAPLLGPADLTAFKVDDRMAQPGGLHLSRPVYRATQHRLDAGQQLAGGKGFDDVIVRPHLQAAHAVVLRATGGENDDR